MVKTTCRIAATGLHSKSISTGQWSLDSLLFFLPKQIRSPEPESGSPPTLSKFDWSPNSFIQKHLHFLSFLSSLHRPTNFTSLSLSLSLSSSMSENGSNPKPSSEISSDCGSSFSLLLSFSCLPVPPCSRCYRRSLQPLLRRIHSLPILIHSFFFFFFFFFLIN